MWQLCVDLCAGCLTPVGHIAENCQSPSRLCYNCREAGHESTNCPHPRTTDGKQCYACGGVGHVKADCPSLRGALGFGANGAGYAGAFGSFQKCFQCGRPGHIARMCPTRRGAFGPPRPRVANPDGSPVKC